MQPTYLPWLGYFAMMDKADVFVFLDSVQFVRRSWQQRNRIKTVNGTQLLTVPVIKKGLRNQIICETKIDHSKRFVRQHKKAIELAYTKAPFFTDYSVGLLDKLQKYNDCLSDYNIDIISWLCKQFSINSTLMRSSSLGVSGEKSDLLCNICQAVEADLYLSALGSKIYLERAEAFKNAGISIAYNEFDHPTYPQLYGPFVPFLSAIDLLFNVGVNSIETIRAGYV